GAAFVVFYANLNSTSANGRRKPNFLRPLPVSNLAEATQTSLSKVPQNETCTVPNQLTEKEMPARDVVCQAMDHGFDFSNQTRNISYDALQMAAHSVCNLQYGLFFKQWYPREYSIGHVCWKISHRSPRINDERALIWKQWLVYGT